MWMLVMSALALAEPDATAPDEGADEVETSSGETPSTTASERGQTAPETIVLPGIEDLPSALDQLTVAGDDGSLLAVLGSFQASRRTIWGASTYIRPSMSVLASQHAAPFQLGIQAGRRWWMLKGPVSPAFSVGTAADFPLAQGRGSVDWSLAAMGGPWFKGIGFQVGPALGWSRWVLGDAELPGAWSADLQGQMVMDLGALVLSLSYAPRWFVSEQGRTAATPLSLGDEAVIRGGAGVRLGLVRVGVDLSHRWTAIGPLDRVGLSTRLKL